MSTTSISVPAALAERLETLAKEHDMGVSDLIEHVLEEYVRWERLSQLRHQVSGIHDEEFTTWSKQVEFFKHLVHTDPEQLQAPPAGAVES